MKKLSDKLSSFIDHIEVPKKPKERVLLPFESKIFRSLKTESERATKGRGAKVVSAKTILEEDKPVRLVIELLGTHSRNVGQHIVKRFQNRAGVFEAVFEATHGGGNVILAIGASGE